MRIYIQTARGNGTQSQSQSQSHHALRPCVSLKFVAGWLLAGYIYIHLYSRTMRSFLFFSAVLGFLVLFFAAEGQAQSTTATPTAATTSLTPAMSSSSVAAFFSALATTAPQQPGSGSQAGDAGSANSGVNSAAGAAGSDTGSITLSRGAIIGIVIVVACVVIFGSKFFPSSFTIPCLAPCAY